MLRLVIIASVLACCLGAVPRIKTPRLDGRIVGGSDADITDYPYQLSLMYRKSHNCGASIISANWALTAAHCVIGADVEDISFRAGSSIRDEDGSVHQASHVIVHENYSSSAHNNDISLVQVSTDFPLGGSVQIIPLTSSTPGTGVEITITGWGVTDSGTLAKQLQVVKVPVVDHAVCEEEYGNLVVITKQMLCAGLPEGGKDSCQSDSGGPAVANGQLVGIVSWGNGCGLPKYAGVYVDVAVLRSWVTEHSGV